MLLDFIFFKFLQSKNRLIARRFFDVEPRGIKPLNPSTNHG